MVVMVIAVKTVGLFQRGFGVIWLFIRMKHQNLPGTEGCAQLMGLLYACLKCITFTYDYSLSKK
jgi:hypothetical protein